MCETGETQSPVLAIDENPWQSVQVSVQELTAAATSSAISAGLWGLDCIDQKTKKRDYEYHYSSVGTGVHVYTVDTVCPGDHVTSCHMMCLPRDIVASCL